MPAKVRPSTTQRGYGARHQAARRGVEPFVLAGGVRCARCGEPIVPGQEWHLGHTDDRSGYTGAEHASCNVRAAGDKAVRMRWYPPPAEVEAEREGLPASHGCWRVPWLAEFLDVPAGAVWPRYMTVPHPQAVGSLGPEFIEWAEGREGRSLRWWQRLVATRLLEVDGQGELVWLMALLTVARQVGKSWLLRELVLWRMHQKERFGEPQDVLHTGKDIQVLNEVIRPALAWAQLQPEYKVSRGAGVMGIELLADQSRWLVRAKTAVYGYSVSVGAVDEAWKVPPEAVDEGLMPTITEREQPQLWLISTAHRQATALMLGRRRAALEQLESGDGVLLVEWSTPRGTPLDSVDGWRQASPHWTPQRERLIRDQFEAAQSGEGEVVEDEADPVEAFRAQWLNQWPDRRVPVSAGEPLLPAGLWADLEVPGLQAVGPLFVAVEDRFGQGAAIAAAAELVDGRLEIDGWCCDDWEAAMMELGLLVATMRVRQLLVGASMLSQVPAAIFPRPLPVGSLETRVGLPLFRDLASGRMVVHDEKTGELDKALSGARVKELATGLALERADGYALVKAVVWAVHAAAQPSRIPAVY